jgi:signal transduction histidine kinase
VTGAWSWRPVAVDAGLIAVAAADALLNTDFDLSPPTVLAGVAVLALLIRRRWPYVAFVLTLPGVTVSGAVIATLVALYTVACGTRNRRMLALCSLAVVIGYAVPWPYDNTDFTASGIQGTLITVIYAVLLGAAPAFLGQLVQARGELAARLREITEAREHEQDLLAQTLLGRERAQLAREMHDVVSHQVSLIAVQAAALQVAAPDPATRTAASTVRGLAVNTLDELRHMVTLLRVSGGRTATLAPQPTLADLHNLVTSSGIEATLEGELPAGLDTATQRAVYRTVQEALTNVRKHAPGARATVTLWRDSSDLGVTVTNGPPTRPALSLPSAQLGLLGLRERAELLDGTITAEHTGDGGYRICLRLPATSRG